MLEKPNERITTGQAGDTGTIGAVELVVNPIHSFLLTVNIKRGNQGIIA
jgi:hypothetical protein